MEIVSHLTFLTAATNGASSASSDNMGSASRKETFLRSSSTLRGFGWLGGFTCLWPDRLLWLARALTDSGFSWESSDATEVLTPALRSTSATIGGEFVVSPALEGCWLDGGSGWPRDGSAVNCCHSVDAFSCSSNADTPAGSYRTADEGKAEFGWKTVTLRWYSLSS